MIVQWMDTDNCHTIVFCDELTIVEMSEPIACFARWKGFRMHFIGHYRVPTLRSFDPRPALSSVASGVHRPSVVRMNADPG